LEQKYERKGIRKVLQTQWINRM